MTEEQFRVLKDSYGYTVREEVKHKFKEIIKQECLFDRQRAEVLNMTFMVNIPHRVNFK